MQQKSTEISGFTVRVNLRLFTPEADFSEF